MVDASTYTFIGTMVASYVIYFVAIKKFPSLQLHLPLLLLLTMSPVVAYFVISFTILTGATSLIISQLMSLVTVIPYTFLIFQWIYRRLSPTQIKTPLVDLSGAKSYFERRLSGYSMGPFYVERYTAEQAKDGCEKMPVEVINLSGSPLVIRGFFVQVFRPTGQFTRLHNFKHEKSPRVYGLELVDQRLPIILGAKDAVVLQTDPNEVIQIGELHTSGTGMDEVRPLMKLCIEHQNGISAGEGFDYTRIQSSLSMLVATRIKNTVLVLARKLIEEGAPPDDLYDKVVEVFKEWELPDPEGPAGVWLLGLLERDYPLRNDYREAIVQRINKRMEVFSEEISKAITSGTFERALSEANPHKERVKNSWYARLRRFGRRN